MSKLKLSIVTVNYNAGDHLIECIQSVAKICNEADITFYIVDNASGDESITKAKALKLDFVKYILNKENLGFGAANNQAFAQIKSGYVLCLNPDTHIEKGLITKMLEFMEDHPDVGAATPAIKLEDGRIDLTAHRGFPTPWASFKYYFLHDDSLYHLTGRDFSGAHEVDAISGAFFLSRIEVLRQVGFFDKDYFMYAEDIDLSFKIKDAGYKIIYIPELEVLHYKGVSTGLKKHSQHLTKADMETRSKMVDYFYSTMKIFYRKRMADRYPALLNWIIYVGIDLKWYLAKRKLTV